ncbi:hypothetical protein DFO66_1188 [Brevibacterium sanguinis]|uniref:Uncharacterized protein n=2 Tax=Brevibacterium TaxID=1696 RepID=A0A366IDC5_9MICO|nr:MULTISPECIES: hypothetical protein [Brevibacterium]RBP61875.1 hypothetical protein DFO66_1188 [Brevibacterium sanguinis]RBP68679.1 hypothetical protein DFO65_11649 [Brevibacterium celere]
MTEMTPAALGGDVPVERWRSDLDDLAAAPARQRHEAIGTLLDDLDAQVGTL